MKKILVRVGIVVAVLLVAGLAVLWFSRNTIFKKSVETVGPYLTKTEVKLDSANLSPFSGSGELKGLFVGNPEGYQTPSAIKVGDLAVAVNLGSIRSDKIIVKSISIDSPEITLEGGLKDNNLTEIMANLDEASGTSSSTPADEESKNAQATASRKIEVDDLVIRNAKVDLHLKLLGGKSSQVTLPEIHLTNLGSDPEGITVASLAKQVFHHILTSTTSVATDFVSKLGKEAGEAAQQVGKQAESAVKNAGDEAKSGLKKATKSLGDLFKK